MSSNTTAAIIAVTGIVSGAAISIMQPSMRDFAGGLAFFCILAAVLISD